MFCLNQGVNALLTGKAGTGKSHLIKQFLSEQSQKKKNCAVTAATGIAARAILGQTINSWAGLGLGRKIMPMGQLEPRIAFYARIRNNDYFRNMIAPKLQRCDVLVIDEISMITGSFLDDIEFVLRNVRGALDIPWGGIQTILVGDFLQLPPVEKGAKKVDWAFKGESYHSERHSFYELCLEKSYRQDAGDWVNCLDEARTGEISEYSNELLLSREQAAYPSEQFEGALLLPLNEQVDEVNTRELTFLPGEIKEFEGAIVGQGTEARIKQLLDGLITPRILTLKIGAKVIATANNSDYGYCNGSIGFIREFKSDRIMVEFEDVGLVPVERHTWDDSHRNASKPLEFRQYPLKLAWAITIHKCQGMTLSKIFVDAKRMFAPGQFYVALSRCKTLEGVSLINYDKSKVFCDPDAKQFYSALIERQATEKHLAAD